MTTRNVIVVVGDDNSFIHHKAYDTDLASRLGGAYTDDELLDLLNTYGGDPATLLDPWRDAWAEAHPWVDGTLAGRGIFYPYAFGMTKCQPSRMQIDAGMHPQLFDKLGVTMSHGYSTAEFSVSALMKAAGCATMNFGKGHWDKRTVAERGYDVFVQSEGQEDVTVIDDWLAGVSSDQPFFLMLTDKLPHPETQNTYLSLIPQETWDLFQAVPNGPTAWATYLAESRYFDDRMRGIWEMIGQRRDLSETLIIWLNDNGFKTTRIGKAALEPWGSGARTFMGVYSPSFAGGPNDGRVVPEPANTIDVASTCLHWINRPDLLLPNHEGLDLVSSVPMSPRRVCMRNNQQNPGINRVTRWYLDEDWSVYGAVDKDGNINITSAYQFGTASRIDMGERTNARDTPEFTAVRASIEAEFKAWESRTPAAGGGSAEAGAEWRTDLGTDWSSFCVAITPASSALDGDPPVMTINGAWHSIGDNTASLDVTSDEPCDVMFRLNNASVGKGPYSIPQGTSTIVVTGLLSGTQYTGNTLTGADEYGNTSNPLSVPVLTTTGAAPDLAPEGNTGYLTTIGTQFDIPNPAGALSGDLIVIALANSSLDAITAPAGATDYTPGDGTGRIGSENQVVRLYAMPWDVGGYSFSTPDSRRWVGGAVAIRGNHAGIRVITDDDRDLNESALSLGAQPCTGLPGVVFGQYRNGLRSNDSVTYTPINDPTLWAEEVAVGNSSSPSTGTSNDVSCGFFMHAEIPPALSTGVASIDSVLTQSWRGYLFEVLPAP